MPCQPQRCFFRTACVLGALGVIAGAFGAHFLKNYLAQTYGVVRGGELLAIFETGARYHLIHAVALLAVSLAGGSKSLPTDGSPTPPATAPSSFSGLDLWASPWAARAAWCWVVGVIIFSGSLYALALTDMKWLGMITPLGGVALIAGWIGMALITCGRAESSRT